MSQDSEWVREEAIFWSLVNSAVDNYKRGYEEHDKLLSSIGAVDDDGADDGENITRNRFGGEQCCWGGAERANVREEIIILHFLTNFTLTLARSLFEVLDPVGLVLAPFQSALLGPITAFRIAKNVITCADANLWFLLTFTLFTLSATLALVPWGRILSLVARAVVIAVLGPQNRLLERKIKDGLAEFFLYSNDPSRSISASAMRKKLRAVLDVRILQEQEARARDFKILYHGNRVANVYKFNVERFNQMPNIEGSGTEEIEKAELKRGEAKRNLMK